MSARAGGDLPRIETQGGVEISWLPQPLFSLDLHTADQLEDVNARNGFAIDLLPRSGIEADVSLVGGQSLSMGLWETRSTSGFTTRPKVVNDVFTIRFVTSGWMLRLHPHEEHVGHADQAMLVPFQDMQSATASDNFRAVSGIVARDTLLASQVALDGADAGGIPAFAPVAAMDGLAMQAFRQTFLRLHGRLGQAAVSTDLLFPLPEEVFAYQLLSVWPRRSSAPPAPEPCTLTPLQRARDYAEANLASPLRLADLAAVAGIGVRCLQHGFKREWGLTPLEFIIRRRLESVHDDLCREENAHIPVIQLARRWGFVHAGDFGQRYRRRYGCTPSQTRRPGRP